MYAGCLEIREYEVRACVYIYIYSGARWYKRENISANIDREVELCVDGLWNKMNLFRINRPICL